MLDPILETLLVPRDEREKEHQLCSPLYGSDGFRRFCNFHCIIQDKTSRASVKFALFPGQNRIVDPMVAGKWLLCLKGRQLGFTWLDAAYVAWKVIYNPIFTVIVISQERPYAQDFLARVAWIMNRLPPYLQPKRTKANTQMMAFSANGFEREVRSVAGGKKAGRSVTADLVIIDEAAYVPFLAETLAAVTPTVEVAKGQIILQSTSAGPSDLFFELWEETYGIAGANVGADGMGPTGYMPIFIRWDERPGRDQAWYDDQARKMAKLGPTKMKQENPNTPEEAFEFASGRIYPQFNRTDHIGDIKIPSGAELYRAIDWGQTESAMVVLWVAHIPGPTGLLVSKDCKHSIREMMGYRYDPDRPEEVLKKNDHTCDALRYLLVTRKLTGLVYVYREWYVEDAVGKHIGVNQVIQTVHEMSGWTPVPPDVAGKWWAGRVGEKYIATVADRAWSLMIETLCQNDIPCEGHTRLRLIDVPDQANVDDPRTEVKDGIAYVRRIIDATMDLEKLLPVSRDEAAINSFRDDQKAQRVVKHAVGLKQRQINLLARALLKGRRNKA